MPRNSEFKCAGPQSRVDRAGQEEGMTPKESERVGTGTISIKSSTYSRRRMRQSVGNARKIV